MIQRDRVRKLNDNLVGSGDFVVYWMQASQRTECNHALEYAIRKANELGKPLVVYFGITDGFPEANRRHYSFMLQGLQEVKRSLEDLGIRFLVYYTSPEKGARAIAEHARLMVVDLGYLRIQKLWRSQVAQQISCPLVQVESDVVVPVETASFKEEYAAATFRPKITKLLPEYLVPLKESKPKMQSIDLEHPGLEEPIHEFDLSDVDRSLEMLNIDRSVPPVDMFQGGTSYAKVLLRKFVKEKLDHYHDLSNHPELDLTSHMSPYLHFGQISPLDIALRLAHVDSPGKEPFLEQLIVRRELSMNFVHYNPNYDKYSSLPEWAWKTLQDHANDKRGYVYSLDELEQARTHDPYWNAAQKEMVRTGMMHNYMRMYWGKKIIEWSESPEMAFNHVLYLNNKYELDGRDPNGFTGVAWCFGKHDRPWKERPIFGKVRYMNAKGLERKFNIKQYVKRFS